MSLRTVISKVQLEPEAVRAACSDGRVVDTVGLARVVEDDEHLSVTMRKQDWLDRAAMLRLLEIAIEAEININSVMDDLERQYEQAS